MGLSMNQEVEFEGDVELGKIVDDKPATSGWASNIMAAYRQVGKNTVIMSVGINTTGLMSL